MDNKIQIANILLTQRCNLNCSYCHIVKDYQDKPNSYPDMKYYTKNELSADEWMKIFNRLKKNNPDILFILYGGEPFLYNDLVDLLKNMNKEDMNYTIISNNSGGIQSRIWAASEQVSFRGFTSSVDPWVADPKWIDVPPQDRSDAIQKSFDGLQRLTAIQVNGYAKDVVAEITCDSRNVHLLHDTVSLLTERDIWSSITMIDKKKSPYYDFASEFDDELLVQQTPEVREQFDKIIKSKTPLLVHIPQLLDTLYNDLPCDRYCGIDQDIHNVTISPDGKFRLCLRIRGVDIPKCELDDLFTSHGIIKLKFNKELHMDYTKFCKGCNWTCVNMSRFFKDQIIDHGI